MILEWLYGEEKALTDMIANGSDRIKHIIKGLSTVEGRMVVFIASISCLVEYWILSSQLSPLSPPHYGWNVDNNR